MPSYADLRESGLARGRVELRAEVNERLVEGLPIKRADLVELDPLPRCPVQRLPRHTPIVTQIYFFVSENHRPERC